MVSSWTAARAAHQLVLPSLRAFLRLATIPFGFGMILSLGIISAWGFEASIGASILQNHPCKSWLASLLYSLMVMNLSKHRPRGI